MIQWLKIAMLVGYLRVHPAVDIRTIPKGDVVHDNRRCMLHFILCKACGGTSPSPEPPRRYTTRNLLIISEIYPQSEGGGFQAIVRKQLYGGPNASGWKSLPSFTAVNHTLQDFTLFHAVLFSSLVHAECVQP